MSRSAMLGLALAMMVLPWSAATAAQHSWTATGVSEGANPLHVSILRDIDTSNDPPALFGIATFVTITFTDVAGNIVDFETIRAMDTYDPLATEPTSYEFNTREPQLNHFHGQGIQSGQEGIAFSGHFEGSLGVHRGFTVAGMFTPGPRPSP